MEILKKIAIGCLIFFAVGVVAYLVVKYEEYKYNAEKSRKPTKEVGHSGR